MMATISKEPLIVKDSWQYLERPEGVGRASMYERQHRKACGTSPGTICIITRRFRLMMEGRRYIFENVCTKWG